MPVKTEEEEDDGSYVNALGIVTKFQIVKHSWLREVAEQSAVLNTIEFRGVYALEVGGRDDLLLRGGE